MQASAGSQGTMYGQIGRPQRSIWHLLSAPSCSLRFSPSIHLFTTEAFGSTQFLVIPFAALHLFVCGDFLQLSNSCSLTLLGTRPEATRSSCHTHHPCVVDMQ